MNKLVTSLAELDGVAKEIADALVGGEVVCLSGDLGAGKTAFTQALARQLGVTQSVTSPTFSLERTYATERGFDLRHYDLYRLETIEAVQGLGLSEYLGQPSSVCVIEWPERAAEVIPEGAVWLYFDYVDATTRRISDHS